MKISLIMFSAIQLWLWGFPWTTSAALSLTSSPLRLANELANTSRTFNITTPVPLEVLPDPWDYKVDGTPITIRFYEYGADLDARNGSILVQHARLIALDHEGVWDQIIEEDLRTDDYGGLELRLYPEARTTWRTWYEVTLAMEVVILLALRREFNFLIRLEGQEGSDGYGLLRVA